jgi:large subunit ribosomal protein L10
VSEVHEVAANSQSVIAAQYAGLTVAQLTDFRSRARAADVHVKVVKNTLARRAMAGTSFECLQDQLTGPLLLVFSRDDPGAGARVMRDFIKQNERLKPTAIVVGQSLLAGDQLDKVAKMPTLDEARAMLLGVFKAPATRLVRTLAEPGAKFVRVLAAYRDSRSA